ncbi:SHOCT domain-containing protein [Campylobacterota bacterium]
MKLQYLIGTILLLNSVNMYADNNNTEEDTLKTQVQDKTICVFKGVPTIEYIVARRFKVGKNTYGNFDSVMPKFLNYANKKLRANTIIDYSISQRFGFWPWRFIRPVAIGTGVVWYEKTDAKCSELGGTVYLIESPSVVHDITDQFKKDELEAENNIYDDLKKLGELHKNKIITDEEFLIEKKKILNSN